MRRIINGNSNPMPMFGKYGATVPRFTPSGRTAFIDSIQILGFIPLTCVTQHERLKAFSQCDCRDWKDDDCYINPVFGDSTGTTDSFKNDKSNFTLEYPFFYNHQWNQPDLSAFSLEVWAPGAWIYATELNDNRFGVFNQLGTMCIKHWTSYTIDWQKVIMELGPGMYRFRVDNNIFGHGSIYVSEPFCLKEWNCKAADKTVRWDAIVSGGRIGSITDDKRLFELCCQRFISDWLGWTSQVWEDSVRIYGFFGRETTEYERVNIEYQNGEIVKIRDEAIQKFEYESALLPKYLHDRFKAYGMMADKLFVSDYNWNNSDYDIKIRQVVGDSAYAPEYDRLTRYSNVKVVFKEAFQNVIRDKCCAPKPAEITPF